MMKRQISQDFALGTFVLTLSITDVREGFKEQHFNLLLTSLQEFVLSDGLTALMSRDRFTTGDGTTFVEFKRNGTTSTTDVKVALAVTYNQPDVESRLQRHLDSILGRLVRSITLTIDEMLKPKPDIKGFVKEFKDFHKKEGHPTPAQLAEMAQKYNLNVFEADSHIGVITTDILGGPVAGLLNDLVLPDFLEQLLDDVLRGRGFPRDTPFGRRP